MERYQDKHRKHKNHNIYELVLKHRSSSSISVLDVWRVEEMRAN